MTGVTMRAELDGMPTPLCNVKLKLLAGMGRFVEQVPELGDVYRLSGDMTVVAITEKRAGTHEVEWIVTLSDPDGNSLEAEWVKGSVSDE